MFIKSSCPSYPRTFLCFSACVCCHPCFFYEKFKLFNYDYLFNCVNILVTLLVAGICAIVGVACAALFTICSGKMGWGEGGWRLRV